MTSQTNDPDWVTRGIVHTLLHTDSKTSSELKTKIGIDSTKKVTYRLGLLKDAGLITTSQVPHQDWDKPSIPPTTATLTRSGEEWAEKHNVNEWDEPDTVDHRLKRLEERVDTLETENQALKLMTGLDTDQETPDALEVRKALYALVDHAENELDVDLMNHTPNYVLREVRDNSEEIDSLLD
ncbi:hypothetical protein [Halorubrum halophilum]|uniref:hypothetical protein n=1 Tax=Halorubrum halophilum TaxID=413816 RepID=UPI00186B1967|nr:hypothetical protein [Halorubrum halophilum]